MSKLIHSELTKFIKSDAKKIKNLNKKEKLSKIQNNLANIFGWRHFNELEKNIKNNINNKEFFEIGNFSREKLSRLKNLYIKRIYEIYPLKEYLSQDPYKINQGLFYKLINTNKKIIKIGKGNNLNISFLNSKNSLMLENKELELLINKLTEQPSAKSDDMWRKRGKFAIEGILKAINCDDQVISYHEEILKCFSLDHLIKYLNSHPLKKIKDQKLDNLYNYIINIPGYDKKSLEENKKPSEDTVMQHGFVFMNFNILQRDFLNKSNKNQKIYTLEDLRNHNGNIIIEYYDYGNMEKDLKLISELI